MSETTTETRAARTLAGAIVLQAVPAMGDDAAGRAALNLAVALLRAGARSLVAGGGGPLVGELQALGGEWMEFDFADSLLRRRRNAGALRALIATERVDLVHAQGIEAARPAAAALRRSRVALITTYMGAPPGPSWGARPQDAMASGQVVIAYSSFAADLIAARHGIPRERIVVIPPSVDTAWFDPARLRPERVMALRKAWRIAPGERVVLLPGRLTPAQGHLTLIDAARMLVTGGLRGVVFVIAGDTAAPDESYATMIDQRIADQGLSRIFRRVGHCSDMPATYALADLVVVPTERATIFSAVAAEAQTMARPVIASDLGALPELIVAPPLESPAHRTGWLVRPRDPLDLARALASALALDVAAWQAVAARAYHLAEARFSPQQVAAATLAAHGALLNSSA